MRLFGGFRWAKIDQAERQQYTYQGELQSPVTGTIDGRSELEAYGIRLGAQTQWTTRWGLGLFGRLAGSVLVGSFDVQQQEVDEVEGTILNFSDEYYQAVPGVEAAVGADEVDELHHQPAAVEIAGEADDVGLDALVGEALRRFLDRGLLEDTGVRIRLTRAGLLVSDALWPAFLG